MTNGLDRARAASPPQTKRNETNQKPEFKAKKDAKHTDRAGFEAWLDSEIATSTATVKVR
jgi:hypothetical protein